MKKYKKYKESGFDYLDMIPSEWELIRLKYSDEVIMGQSPASEDYAYEPNDYPFLQGNAEFSQLYPTPRIWCDKANKFSEINDILISVRAPIGAINISDKVYGIGRGLAAIRGIKHSSKYLFYFFTSLTEYLNSEGTGSTFTAISTSKLKEVIIPNISLEEQTKIAKYLDYQTAIIDQLILQKEKLIELLKEKKQAVINEAVTKGLNPKAKMKDSGIEWLGEVPEHWSVSFLKRFCLKITDGAHFSPKTEFEGRNYISVKDVDEFGNIDLINCKKISQADFDGLVRNGCQPSMKDVLLTKDGTIGRAAVVKDDNDFVSLSSLGIITPNDKKLDSEYLRLFLISGINVDQMFSLIAGAALTRLTIEKMKHLVITIPPINEQREIVSRLEKKVVGFDNSIEIISTQIEKLKEYRQSIISEAVTGKIDVRNWQAKLL